MSRATLYRKMAAGEWASREIGQGRNGKPVRAVVLASLPEEMQRQWLELHPQGGDQALPPEKSEEVSADPHDAASHEQRVIRDYQLIAQSHLRGETAEDRVAQLINPDIAVEDGREAQDAGDAESQAASAIVHRLTRLDRKRFCEIPDTPLIDSGEIGRIESDWSIFFQAAIAPVREFDYDEAAE